MDMDLGSPYLLYLYLKEKSDALKVALKVKRKKVEGIDIFKVDFLHDVCNLNDLSGFSELYKPLIRSLLDPKSTRNRPRKNNLKSR